MTRGLRMIVVVIGFLHFPEATNWSYIAIMSWLKRLAITVGRYKDRRFSARPKRVCYRPCHFPD